MLQTSSKILIENKCVVDGKEIAGFRATFESNDAENLTLLPYQIDKAACKEHRAVVRADQAEFEDYAYSVQEAIASASKTEETAEAE